MAKKQEVLEKDKVKDIMLEKLKELGYTDINTNLPLVEVDENIPKNILAATDENEVVIFCYPVEAGLAQQIAIQDEGVFWSRLITEERIANFVWISDGEYNYYFDNNKNSSIAELPEKSDWRSVVRGMSTDRKKHLIEVSEEFAKGNWRFIQKKFNTLHERLYPSGGFSSANQAIDEICRLMFIKIHLERYPSYVVKENNKRLSDIFNSETIRNKENKEAIPDLKAAFKELASLPEYIAEDLTGAKNRIFPEDDYLHLSNSENMAYAVEIFEDFRLTPDENDKKRVHEDLLGWAYDVFLRGKYDGSGGLATYLTPSQVTECMAQIGFNDISDEEIWDGYKGMNKNSKPQFLMGDIACGTGRFLIAGLKFIKDRVLDTLGKSDEEKRWWLQQIKEHAFFGSDQSEGSLIKARLNMLLYGNGHSQLLQVEDSILDQNIDTLIGKFDLILTNPPFGKGKYDADKGDNYKNGLCKMRGEKDYYHESVRDLLDDERFKPELGYSWTKDRTKKKELDKADPASLFIDRNLQLLKPGGRLLIVLPDGILSNSGDKYIREYIMGTKDEETGEFFGGKAVVKAVISLPTQTFAISGTGAKTSVLYIQKKGTYQVGSNVVSVDKQGSIFMAVAEHVGYLKKGTDEIPDPNGNDLKEIAEAYSKEVK